MVLVEKLNNFRLRDIFGWVVHVLYLLLTRGLLFLVVLLLSIWLTEITTKRMGSRDLFYGYALKEYRDSLPKHTQYSDEAINPPYNKVLDQVTVPGFAYFVKDGDVWATAEEGALKRSPKRLTFGENYEKVYLDLPPDLNKDFWDRYFQVNVYLLDKQGNVRRFARPLNYLTFPFFTESEAIKRKFYSLVFEKVERKIWSSDGERLYVSRPLWTYGGTIKASVLEVTFNQEGKTEVKEILEDSSDYSLYLTGLLSEDEKSFFFTTRINCGDRQQTEVYRYDAQLEKLEEIISCSTQLPQNQQGDMRFEPPATEVTSASSDNRFLYISGILDYQKRNYIVDVERRVSATVDPQVCEGESRCFNAARTDFLGWVADEGKALFKQEFYLTGETRYIEVDAEEWTTVEVSESETQAKIK